MNNDTGIYAITSPSGKFYIGSAVSFKTRWRGHLRLLRLGTHHSPLLQAAFLKYGESGLTFSKIALCAITELLFLEQRYIDRLNPQYNVCKVVGSRLGTKSPQSGEKISKALRGRKRSAEAIEKTAAAHRGRINGPLSQATREKLSKSLKGNRNNDGRPPASAETRAKLSAAGKGKLRPKSEEHRAKIAASLRGNVVTSQAARLKISAANKGKPKSPEHRAKIAAAVAATKRRNREARIEAQLALL